LSAAALSAAGIMTASEQQHYLMDNYARLPVTMTRGQGAWLWDDAGKRYLDALSGIGVCALGHAHPAVTAALIEQARTLVHCSNLYRIEPQQRLAEQLCAVAAMDRAFFGNSGAEAIEAAIKLARLHGHKRGISQPHIIVTENGFHGRTLATLSATGNRKVQAGFEPLVQGFIRVPYNDIPAIESVAANNGSGVVAVLVEPIQGEGGINVPDDDYLSALRRLCDQHGWLMIVDEIQTGIGRTGQWFGFQHGQAAPDIISVAKGLGNGVPIGACLARGDAAELFQPGHHGSTFGGNPLVCSTALAVLETISAEGLVQRAATTGRWLLETLTDRLQDNPEVADIRGQGLMIGIELHRACPELVQQALENGLLISVQAGRVIRLLPPLIISDAEAGQIADQVVDLVDAFAGQRAA
jgi:acetylornithine aminotransferase